MEKTFKVEGVELNLPDNSNHTADGEVIAHDYIVKYSDTVNRTFVATEIDTNIRHIWQCDCKYDDLTEYDHEEILEYRGIFPDETVCTLEDWWMSGMKMWYVGRNDSRGN